MPKSIYNVEYRAMLDLLKQERDAAGVMQAELGKRLKLDQSSISRIESGDRRIDPIELRNYCIAIGLGLPAFAKLLEQRLASQPSSVVPARRSK